MILPKQKGITPLNKQKLKLNAYHIQIQKNKVHCRGYASAKGEGDLGKRMIRALNEAVEKYRAVKQILHNPNSWNQQNQLKKRYATMIVNLKFKITHR
jgi:hypothetical protein